MRSADHGSASPSAEYQHEIYDFSCLCAILINVFALFCADIKLHILDFMVIIYVMKRFHNEFIILYEKESV